MSVDRALVATRDARAPGPGPIPDRLLRALDVTVARRMEGLLAGDYRSTLLGRRDASSRRSARTRPGDDVRQIDWNVTARTGEPHVRVQHAERVLVTWLVLDTSPSMSFGTADRRKADVAEGVAVAVGHVATRRGNRLGVVTFGDEEPRSSPVRQGRLGLIGLLAALRDEPEPAPGRVGATSLGEAIRQSRRDRPPALARRRRLRLPRPATTGARRCSSSPAATTSSPSRSATRASRSCRTRASSGSSTPRRAASSASTRAARSLRGRFAEPRAPPSGARSPQRARVARRPPRRAHHVRRLAARARALPAEAG